MIHCRIPSTQVPSWNVQQAIEKGVGKKFLLVTWGGLGDQVCAEPTLRYAFKAFPTCAISLASEMPELFDHLPFKEVFDLKKVRPIYENYMVFNTIVPPSNLLWEFISHCTSHCVDFASICAFRSQLPVVDREVKIHADMPNKKWAAEVVGSIANHVVIHPGKHWPSKTFPKEWWDRVIRTLQRDNKKVILIGANTDDNRGTVDVDAKGCLDLRNETSIKELIWVLKNASVLITNDSSPLHIAAAGHAFIGFIASCKHPDYITHWRYGKWGWRMENLGVDGIWNHLDHSPVQDKEVTVEFLPDGLMEKILPHPEAVVEYVNDCFNELNGNTR